MTVVSAWLLAALCCIAVLYVVLAACAPRVKRGVAYRESTQRLYPPISILKPLCGAEPRLYENLATFCEQRYPCFQLLCGVSSPSDPAIGIVRRLQAAYPQLDIELIINARVHGQNLKVSNLINMTADARHELLVIADSDIAVAPDYLETVTAPLAAPDVGVVTCLYHARSVGGFWPLWPRMGALFINEWFAPSVRIAHAFGSTRFGFGATLALRRSVLERLGGFERLKDCLADDYWLAEHVRQLDLRTVLSEVTVSTDVIEPDFTALWLREIRWLRTIRSINPLGFAFLFITFTTPWLITGMLIAYGLSGSLPVWLNIALAVCSGAGILARVMLHARSARAALHDGDARTFLRDLPLVPLRDTLLALQWLVAAFGSSVHWRGSRVAVVGAATRASVVEGSDGV